MDVNLYNIAIVITRYNLGDKEYFIKKFQAFSASQLEKAWNLALTKVHSREIIKDASSISIVQKQTALAKFQSFTGDTEQIFFYLNSHFDPKTLPLDKENIERHYRQLLAVKYIDTVSSNFTGSISKNKSSNSGTRQTLKIILILSTILVLIESKRIINGFTPVSVLAERLHEKSKRKFNGAICNDGWTSHSQGRGTCSYHGGVDYYFYKGEYSKTIEECTVEAKNISWIGN
jgi:hypothetical protein